MNAFPFSPEIQKWCLLHGQQYVGSGAALTNYVLHYYGSRNLTPAFDLSGNSFSSFLSAVPFWLDCNSYFSYTVGISLSGSFLSE